MPTRIIKRKPSDVVPLSVQQKNIWIEHEIYTDNVSYNIVSCLHLSGHLDVELFKKSIGEIVQRHEVLRTTFSVIESEPRQIIHPQMEVSIPEISLDMFPSEEQTSEIRKMADRETQSSFDLEHGPLFRFTLTSLNNNEHVFLMTVHHIVMDGWSFGLFVNEFTTIYDAFRDGKPSPLPEIDVQYSDYAVWQDNERNRVFQEQDVGYWNDVARDAEFGEFPIDHPRVLGRKGKSATQTIAFPDDLTEKIKSFSREARATLFVTLLSGFQLLIHKYTGQENILSGFYTAGRDHGEVQNLLGHFSSLTAVRTDFSGYPSFREIVERTRQSVFTALAYGNMPTASFSRRQTGGNGQDCFGTTLFPVVFNFHNYPNQQWKSSCLNIATLPVATDSVRFDMEVTIVSFNEKLSVAVQYNSDIYSEDTIKRILGYYRNIMLSAIDNPDRLIREISPMSPVEIRQVVEEWNSEKVDYPVEATIHQLIDAAASENPDAVALVYKDREISYRELTALSNHIARSLIEMGVGPEVMVGVCMERSHNLIITLLAILKAGGVYVPLDPIYPDEKLAYMVQNSTATILLTEKDQVAKFSYYAGKTIDVTSMFSQFEMDNETFYNLPPVEICSENSAYLIYTSGSTGNPKGVLVTHQNVVNYFCFMNLYIDDANTSRTWLFSTSVCFDPSVLEMFWTLSRGYRVVVLPNESSGKFLDIDAIPELICKYHVSHFQCTPSVLGMLVNRADGLVALKHLAKLMVGGECLPVSLAKRLSAEVAADIYNVYGPTETTLWATYYRLQKDEEEHIPIGRPLPNYEIYILDKDLHPVPVGAYGEVNIGGDGIARGYFNDSELTARKYLSNPFSNRSGARIYQTGDIARYGADGVIEFLGRTDRQVKIRGHRIELGEIEAALLTCDKVREAVVVTSGTDINQKLLGYIIPGVEPNGAEDRDSYVKKLKENLRPKLPEFMIPSSLMVLKEFPKLSNGKIDRKSLPIPELQKGNRLQDDVLSPTETTLMGMWKDVLGIEGFHVDDNFMDIGGDSLSAIMIVNKIKFVLQANVTTREFFDNPTVKQLANLIKPRIGCNMHMTIDRIRPIDRDGDLPLSSFQENRLIYEFLLDINEVPYLHVSAWFSNKLSGNIDMEALETAFNYVINRHEVFRTIFWPSLGSVLPTMNKWGTVCQTCRMNPGVFLPKLHFKQSVQPTVTMNFSYYDISEYGDEDKYIELSIITNEVIQNRYLYESAPLTRASLIRLAENEHVLVVAASHLITDAFSMSIYEKELAHVYSALVNKQSVSLPDIEIQYSDYVAWMKHRLETGSLDSIRSYWQKQFDGYTPTNVTILPFADMEGSKDDPDFSIDAKYYFHPISDELCVAIRKYASSVNMTTFTIFMTGFILYLYEESGKDDIGIYTFLANRTRPENENVIGLFATGNIIRVKINANDSLQQFATAVFERLNGALNNQEFMITSPASYESKSLYDEVVNRPITCELLIYTECASFSGLDVEKAVFGRDKSEYALRSFVIDSGNNLSLMFQYNLDLFDVADIGKIATQTENIIRKIVANHSANVSTIIL